MFTLREYLIEPGKYVVGFASGPLFNLGKPVQRTVPSRLEKLLLSKEFFETIAMRWAILYRKHFSKPGGFGGERSRRRYVSERKGNIKKSSAYLEWLYQERETMLPLLRHNVFFKEYVNARSDRKEFVSFERRSSNRAARLIARHL